MRVPSRYAMVVVCVCALASACDDPAAPISPGPATEPDSGVAAPTGNGDGPACPIDPDAYIGGDPTRVECPTYWECDNVDRGWVCTNPGPDLPDATHDWECEDVAGQTVCRGHDYPDEGSSSGWTCITSGEFVVCTRDAPPDYPDSGPGVEWTCYYRDEFRICESFPSDDHGWTCWDSETGRVCRQHSADYPDDRVWDCYDQAGDTVCQTAGGDLPDGEGSGEWHCEVQGEFVVCTREAPDYPDEAGDTPWDCHYEDEFRICAPPDSPSSPWPDGWSDVCTASSARWCDDAVYCSWGRQTCRPDGHWGPCIEPSVTATGTITDRPATACACRYFLFNEDCCEDQSDRDGDLHADCIVPADHVAPSCTSDGSLCSFCDVHSQCGGDADFCLFGDDGYAFCGQDCSSAPCPAGYTCSPVPIPGGTAQQCTPMGGLCD